MLLLDQVAYSNHFRRRHPAEKVLFSLGMLGTCLLLPPWPACGLTWYLTTSSLARSVEGKLVSFLMARRGGP